MFKPLCFTAIALTLAGCGRGDRSIEPAAAPTNWRTMVTQADRERLRGWRAAWLDALPRARRADASAIAAQGALFEPDRALGAALPPPGSYKCRVFKLGAAGTAMRDYTAYPWFQCRIDDEGDVRSFYKADGSQRPVGLLFPDSDARAIFLGTLMLGDETSALQYGRDATRDMVGYVERVGDKRWRLVLPSPRFESLLDVIELVPA
jgi:hypothetical protein